MSPEGYKGSKLKKYLVLVGLAATIPAAIKGLRNLYEAMEKKKADNTIKRRRENDVF